MPTPSSNILQFTGAAEILLVDGVKKLEQLGHK